MATQIERSSYPAIAATFYKAILRLVLIAAHNCSSGFNGLIPCSIHPKLVHATEFCIYSPTPALFTLRLRHPLGRVRHFGRCADLCHEFFNGLDDDGR